MTSGSKMARVVRISGLVLILLGFAVIANEYFRIRSQMHKAADILDKMATAQFSVDADITDTIPINTRFRVCSSIPVIVQMEVKTDFPLQMTVGVNQRLRVPVEMNISKVIPVDTVFRFPDGFRGRMNDTFPINDRMLARILGIFNVPVKIKGMLPIDKNLNITSDGVRGQASIPINLPINDSISIQLNMKIPVSDTIPLHLPINAKANISFITTLPVEGRIPIHIRKQIPVSLEKTELNQYFKELGETLKGMLR